MAFALAVLGTIHDRRRACRRAAWPSVFGDSRGAAALQHKEIVIKVSLRD
jgi:hypothetical protein